MLRMRTIAYRVATVAANQLLTVGEQLTLEVGIIEAPCIIKYVCDMS